MHMDLNNTKMHLHASYSYSYIACMHFKKGENGSCPLSIRYDIMYTHHDLKYITSAECILHGTCMQPCMPRADLSVDRSGRIFASWHGAAWKYETSTSTPTWSSTAGSIESASCTRQVTRVHSGVECLAANATPSQSMQITSASLTGRPRCLTPTTPAAVSKR